MVEIFKTNVEEAQTAKKVIDLLLQHFPGSTVTFDLEDCDKVLRIVGGCCAEKAKDVLNSIGISCSLLD